MKNYSFRLATVLRIRRVESLLARERVGVAARRLTTAVAREREVSGWYQAGIAWIGELDSAAFAAAQQRGERLAEIVVTAAEQRAVSEAHLVTERLGAVRAERRVAVLERLDDRRRREWLAGVAREDVALLDDFANVRAASGSIGADVSVSGAGARGVADVD
ncbi:MAG: hypothetical protein ABSG36_03130 [Acidimicrobiales bacterium]|jgi:hypothetical protein